MSVFLTPKSELEQQLDTKSDLIGSCSLFQQLHQKTPTRPLPKPHSSNLPLSSPPSALTYMVVTWPRLPGLAFYEEKKNLQEIKPQDLKCYPCLSFEKD